MPRDDALMVDIVEHAQLLRTSIEMHGRTGFDADPAVRMGFTHMLQIIGEAARQISEPGRERFPDVPWKQIVGMRHLIVHEYFRIDFNVVWETSVVHVPELLKLLEPEYGPILDARKDKKHKP